MNRKIIKFLGASLLTLALVSCGNSSSGSTGSGSDTGSDTGSESTDTGSHDYDDNNYSVIVYNPDGTRYSAGGIYVLWCTSANCLAPVEVNENGVAEKNIPDNDYFVHLDGLPKKLTYDPNIYNANASNKHLDIQLYDVTTPLNGEGTAYNRYDMKVDCFYRVSITESKPTVYYGFTPKEPGKYKIESYAQTALSTDEADPSVADYGTNKNYIPSTPLGEDDNSKDGINFCYNFELNMDAFEKTNAVDENGDLIPATDANGDYISGWSYTFAVSATAKNNKATFMIRITRTGDAEPTPKTEVTNIEPTTPIAQAADPADGEVFTRGTLLEGGDKAVYNWTDGYYHLNSADGELIYAKLKSNCEFFDIAIVYFSAAGGTNALRVEGGTEDYQNFVEEYCKYCNKDGAYPVNSEIKEFLDKLQRAQGYFLDGGYVSSVVPDYAEGCEWLFACGYYKAADGTADSPYLIDSDDPITVALEENQEVYYKLYLANYVGVTLTSTNAYACLTDADGTEYTSETGFTYTKEFESGAYVCFSLKFSDGHAGNIGLRVTGLTEIPIEE